MKERKDAASILLDFPILVEAGEKIELAEEKKSNEVIARFIFPPTLYENAKSLCVRDNISLNECVNQLLSLYVQGKITFR